MEEYEKRARERVDAEGEDAALPPGVITRPRADPAPFRAAEPGMRRVERSERAYLQARDHEVELEGKLGKRRLVTDTTPASQTGGYWCELCQCTLSDSLSYLSHVNGIKRAW